MVFDIEFLKKEAEINLVYNYTIRPVTSYPGIPEGRAQIEFDKTEGLSLEKTYIERSGFPVKMVEQVFEDRGEFHHGYHFLGDNGVWYKPDGTTSYIHQASLNDVVWVLE